MITESKYVFLINESYFQRSIEAQPELRAS